MNVEHVNQHISLQKNFILWKILPPHFALYFFTRQLKVFNFRILLKDLRTCRFFEYIERHFVSAVA